jgi:hypothetical protein
MPSDFSNAARSSPGLTSLASTDEKYSSAPWNLHDAALLSDVEIIDSDIYWDNWNDLVREFEINVDCLGLNDWEPT